MIIFGTKEAREQRKIIDSRRLNERSDETVEQRSSNVYELNEYNPARDCEGRYSFAVLAAAD